MLKIHHNIDDIALVGHPLIDFDVKDESTEKTKNEKGGEEEEKVGVVSKPHVLENASTEPIDVNTVKRIFGDHKRILATPAVRRIAKENNVNLIDVAASGRFGNVLKSDVLEYLNIIPPTHEKNRPRPLKTDDKFIEPKILIQSQPSSTGDRIEKLKDVRKIMFKTMTESLKIPHFVYSDEVNVTDLIKVRETLKQDAESLGARLTFMPFFIKAASLALAKHPILNSSLDVDSESIIYKSSHNISIAMATKNGLVVPNVKNCEQKSVLQIALELNELLERARNGRLAPNDFANGTFSLSNIGVVGGTYTKPCIVSPQVAIGAIGTTQIVPRFVGDTDAIQRTHLLHVSWAADHRVIDGVTMARFSNDWKRYIEHPNRFILQ